MTKIFGILNITPDSFSDGGVNFEVDRAVKTLESMKANNIFAVDIGAESTRPNAAPVSPEEEIERLKIILPIAVKMGLTVSLDSRNIKTVEWGLKEGVKIVNDVSGFKDLKMIELVRDFKAKAIFMHSLTVPTDVNITLKEENFMQEIYDFAKLKIEEFVKSGVSIDDLIFDPGIGFGKTGRQSIEIIKNIDFFYSLGVKVLVGHSRKSFLKTAFKKEASTLEEKDYMTSIFSSYLIAKKVDFLRLHNFEIISSLI